MNRSEKLVMDFEDFVEGRKGWALKRDEDRIVGSRTFDYGRYSAMLWAEMLRRPAVIEAHISIPFSGGPEESGSFRKMDGLKEWIDHKEGVLQVPLRISECRTYSGALHAADMLRASADLYTVTYVFGLNFHDQSPAQIRYQLVRRCAPNVVPAGGGRG